MVVQHDGTSGKRARDLYGDARLVVVILLYAQGFEMEGIFFDGFDDPGFNGLPSM